QVVLGDHRLGRERDDLLTQIDERLEAVHERHQDREAGQQGPVVASESFDDPGPGLGHDPDGASGHDQQEDNYDDRDDCSSHAHVSYSMTSAVAPLIWTPPARVPRS